VHDITYGSPIGNPPHLSKCFLPHNLSSLNILPKIIEQELEVEVSAHHMSGPFTLEQASVFFGGPFCSSPVGLVEKVPGDSQWRMIRHLSKQDDEGHSSNGWVVDSDEFPTIYFTASWVCHYVGPSPHHSFPVPLTVLSPWHSLLIVFHCFGMIHFFLAATGVFFLAQPLGILYFLSFHLDDEPWALICFDGQ